MASKAALAYGSWTWSWLPSLTPLQGLTAVPCQTPFLAVTAALEAEVEAYLAGFAGEVGVDGRRSVVSNGHARPRSVTTAAGAAEVAAPRINDRRVGPSTGGRARFRSLILPSWCRKSPKVTEVLPLP